jgi:FKBP-type peptidyl-prolyl cis-trans isomerase
MKVFPETGDVMRRFMFAVIGFSFIMGCASAEPEAPATVTMETDDQKTLYALGFTMARTLGGANFDDAEIQLIQRGLADGIRGTDAQVELDVYGPQVNTMMAARMKSAADAEKQESQAYCDKMAGTEGATRTASGAIYIETQAGDGATPGPTDTVKLHYHGTLRDGRVFDSSVDKGSPATFSVNGVIPCFSEGVQQMKVGGKATLVCPSDTAYGDRGSGALIRPGAALTFEVELLEVVAGT